MGPQRDPGHVDATIAVSATVDGLSGSITFAGLESYEDGKPEVTTPFDLAGTVEWTCEEPAGVASLEGP